MKKILLAIFALILLAGFVSSYEISKQEFNIQVFESGFGVITEKYYFEFADKKDLNDSMQAVKKNGQDLLSWRVFDERINPYFESPETISLKGFSFDPNINVLELKYTTDKQIAQKIKEDTRSELWRLKPGFLQKFEQGTLIIVPKNIKIEILLPADTQLNTELLPPTVQTTKNSLSLHNVRVNSLNIQYNIPKPIAKTIGITELAQWLQQTGLLYAIIAAIIIIGIVLTVKRKTIAEKIENYIIEHSEISSKEEKEEIEIED